MAAAGVGTTARLHGKQRRIRRADRAPVQGQAVDGRPLAALSLREGDSPGDCDVLFLAARRQREQSELLQGVTRGVLTVGETVQFMREGGMVRFLTENNRVRFQINQKAAEAAGLKISSKLLTLSVK